MVSASSTSFCWSNARTGPRAPGYPELALFNDKLRSRGRPLGIFVAAVGITGDPASRTAAYEVLNGALREGREIIVLTRREIEDLGDTDELVLLLKKKRAQLASRAHLPALANRGPHRRLLRLSIDSPLATTASGPCPTSRTGHCRRHRLSTAGPAMPSAPCHAGRPTPARLVGARTTCARYVQLVRFSLLILIGRFATLMSCSVDLCDRDFRPAWLRRVALNGWGKRCSGHLFGFGEDSAYRTPSMLRLGCGDASRRSLPGPWQHAEGTFAEQWGCIQRCQNDGGG